jgi:hypothetical protein
VIQQPQSRMQKRGFTADDNLFQLVRGGAGVIADRRGHDYAGYLRLWCIAWFGTNLIVLLILQSN